MRSLPASLYSLLIILLVTGFWFWLEATRPEAASEVRDVAVLKVQLARVEQSDIQLQSRITGRLLPARRAAMHFEVSGPLAQRLAEPGQQVGAEEELLRIKTGDFEDALSDAKILLEQEKAAIARDQQQLALVIEERKLLKRDVERMVQLGKRSLASQSQTDEMKRMLLNERFQEADLRHRVQTAETRLKTRQLALDKARRNLQRTVLKAPFSATVNKIGVEVGDYVTPGQSVIELVQVEQLDLYVEATGELLQGISLNKSVAVTIAGRDYQGRVLSFQSDPDPSTHTHALRIRLAADQVAAGDLFPGQLGDVMLSGKFIPSARVVPITAVLREKTQSYVFRLQGDHVEKLTVQVDGRFEDKLLIRSGVEVGDQIVARHVAVLEDGQKVVAENNSQDKSITQTENAHETD